jgi:hypothetical protein
LVFLWHSFSPFCLPLPVLVFCNPAFLPRGHTTVCFFFLYSLGLVLDSIISPFIRSSFAHYFSQKLHLCGDYSIFMLGD